MLTYAGIGSRRTPPEVLSLMTRVAKRLDTLGFQLQSGGAVGADSAFEEGATSKRIYYVDGAKIDGGMLTGYTHHQTNLALETVGQFHPAPEKLKKYPRAVKLMARNSFQVLGPEHKTFVSFVLAWTPDGSLYGRGPDSGGTGQALRIASYFKIPTFNLARPDELDRLKPLIESLTR